MEKKIFIAPSILACDFSSLKDEIKKIEDSGADSVHFDIMDGHFVPNLTFGIKFVKDLRKYTQLNFVTHLMVERPEKYFEGLKDAGSDGVIFHIEATRYPFRALDKLEELNLKKGIAINPVTSLDFIFPLLQRLDYVLVMSVEPGFAGQEFIRASLEKIEKIKKHIDASNLKTIIAVDGGVNSSNIKELKNAGATYFVLGKFFFENKDYKNTVSLLKNI